MSQPESLTRESMPLGRFQEVSSPILGSVQDRGPEPHVAIVASAPIAEPAVLGECDLDLPELGVSERFTEADRSAELGPTEAEAAREPRAARKGLGKTRTQTQTPPRAWAQKVKRPQAPTPARAPDQLVDQPQKPRTRAEKKARVMARAGLLGLVESDSAGAGLSEVLDSADVNLASIDHTQSASLPQPDRDAEHGLGLRVASDTSLDSLAKIDLEAELNRVGKDERAAASMVTEDITVSVRHHEADVRERLSHYETQVRTCYERRLKADPGMAGRVVLELEVEGGVVFSTFLAEDTITDRSLSRCIQRHTRKWSFPSDVTGVIVAPYVFSPR